MTTSRQSDKYRRRISLSLKRKNALKALSSKRPHGADRLPHMHVSARFPQLGHMGFLFVSGFSGAIVCLAAGRLRILFRTMYDLRRFSAFRVLLPGHHSTRVGAKANAAHRIVRASRETNMQDPNSTAVTVAKRQLVTCATQKKRLLASITPYAAVAPASS